MEGFVLTLELIVLISVHEDVISSTRLETTEIMATEEDLMCVYFRASVIIVTPHGSKNMLMLCMHRRRYEIYIFSFLYFRRISNRNLELKSVPTSLLVSKIVPYLNGPLSRRVSEVGKC